MPPTLCFKWCLIKKLLVPLFPDTPRFLQNLHDFEGWIFKQEGSLADYVKLKNPHTQVPWRSKGYLSFSHTQNTKPSILLTFQHFTLTFDRRGFPFQSGRNEVFKTMPTGSLSCLSPRPPAFFSSACFACTFLLSSHAPLTESLE